MARTFELYIAGRGGHGAPVGDPKSGKAIGFPDLKAAAAKANIYAQDSRDNGLEVGILAKDANGVSEPTKDERESLKKLSPHARFISHGL